MTANRWKYFRWTPRTFWISFAWMVAVPSAVAYLGYKTDVSEFPLPWNRPAFGTSRRLAQGRRGDKNGGVETISQIVVILPFLAEILYSYAPIRRVNGLSRGHKEKF